MPAFVLGIWQWFLKGGWQVLMAIGVAVGIFLSVQLVVGKLQRLGEIENQLGQIQTQQKLDAARIERQNQENQELLNSSRVNAATIGELRRRLTELGGTITPDIDASQYESQLEALIHNQYTCMEQISRNDTNATCA